MYRMRPISVTAHVGADPGRVFDFVKDTRNDPIWCENVETVELVHGETVAPGTEFRFHQHLDRPGGKRMQFDGTVRVVSVGDRTITWTVTDRFQERTITIDVAPERGGSRITQTTTAAFTSRPGLARFVYPMLARRTFKRQFARLASHFE